MKGAPNVATRSEIRDGVPEVVQFCITAKPNGRAVRTADLNGWQPLEGLALNVFRQVGRINQTTLRATPVSGSLAPTDDRQESAMRDDLQGAMERRRGTSLAELEEVAKVYREAIGGRPTEAVHLRMGYKSRRTAARRVHEAREADLLPKTTKGKAKA